MEEDFLYKLYHLGDQQHPSVVDDLVLYLEMK